MAHKEPHVAQESDPHVARGEPCVARCEPGVASGTDEPGVARSEPCVAQVFLQCIIALFNISLQAKRSCVARAMCLEHWSTNHKVPGSILPKGVLTSNFKLLQLVV